MVGKTLPIILASASPRRQALLAQIGIDCAVLPVDVDESQLAGESPAAYVERLARAKAKAGWRSCGRTDAIVIGADTAVVVDDAILGKPNDRSDGLSMLARLSGRSHRVFTGVALCSDQQELHRLSESVVTFRQLTEAEQRSYWDSGEPRDKAGGYAIQGLGAVFVASLAGSYSGVMGLPLYETAEMLAAAGVNVFA